MSDTSIGKKVIICLIAMFVEVRKTIGQIDDLLSEINQRVKNN